MRTPTAVLVAFALVLPPLAGCVTPGALAEDALARPRFGDRAEYAVSGHLVEFARWANGFALVSAAPRLALSVEAAEGRALDGVGARHDVFRVREELADGGEFGLHREFLVSPALGAIVQGYAPLSGKDAVVSFDERGYPWAWGASAWHGERLAEGKRVALELPANGGQPAPLALTAEVEARERVGGHDAWRVAVEGPHGVAWLIWLAPDVPFPVRVDVRIPRDAWASHVRLDDVLSDELAFRAELVAYAPGDAEVPARDAAATWPAGSKAAFAAWNGEQPPDGDGAYTPFLLRDAVTWAKTADPAFSRWYAQHAGAILYRATYLSRPSDVPQATTHVWLVQYVSKDDAYFEIQVERTLPDAGAATPGFTRTASSGPVAAPRGEHGWFAPDSIPAEILPIDAAVNRMRDVFQPEGVEIFVRSFDDPPGYSYYVDGGFEEDLGRYTVIINAQTGFMQAGTGPLAPVVA